MEANVRSALQELRERFDALYGDRLANMVLYGSQARGDAGKEADIDVLVVLRGEVSPCAEIDRTADTVADISLDHSVVVCCVFVSEESFRNRRSPLLLNVRREGVSL